MIIFYLIFYIGSFAVSLGGLGLVLYYLRNPQKYGFDKVKLEQIDFIGVLERCGGIFQKKKSAILIYFAQKGFIKIRKEEDGRIFIDKLKNFENMGYFKYAMDNLYSKYVSFHGDDNAIMSYETVAWDDAKTEFRKNVKNVIDDNQRTTDKTPSEKNANEKTGYNKIVDTVLGVMWAFCIMPIAITYAQQDMSDKWASIFAIYFLTGIMYAVFKVIIKIIRFSGDFFGQLKTESGLINLLLTFIDVVIKAAMYLFIFCEAVFFIAILSVTGEYLMNTPFGLNAVLEVVMFAVTLILLFVKYKYNRMKTGSIERTIKNSLKLKKIKKLLNKEDRDDALLLARVFDKAHELKKEGLTEEVPDWYEGNDWRGVEELMLQLDGK